MKESKFVSSKEFYGKDYGSNLYVCDPCNAYIGTHKNSDKPLGTMAKYQLRELRKRAHSLFDPLWKSRKMSRSKAYRWLQKVMNLSSEEAHIGLFDENQCRKIIRILEARYRKEKRVRA